MFILLIVVMVSQEYTHVKICKIVQFKYMWFIPQLDLSKAGFKNT